MLSFPRYKRFCMAACCCAAGRRRFLRFGFDIVLVIRVGTGIGVGEHAHIFDGGDEELDDIIRNTGDGIIQPYDPEEDDGTWDYNIGEDDTEKVIERDFGYENGIDPVDDTVEDEIDFEQINHDIYYDQDGSLFGFVDFNEEAPIETLPDNTGDGHGNNKVWDNDGNLIEIWDFEDFAPKEMVYSNVPYSRNRINIQLKLGDYGHNAIELREGEGVIVDMNKYVGRTEMEESILTNQAYKNTTIERLDDLRRTLIATASIEKADEMIRYVYNQLFASYNFVKRTLEDPEYVNNIHKRAEDGVAELPNWFKENNPYRWADFDVEDEDEEEVI